MKNVCKKGIVALLTAATAFCCSTAVAFATTDTIPSDPTEGAAQQVAVVKVDQAITAADKTLTLNKTAKLNAKGVKDGGALTYKSSDTKVATITKSGVIKARKIGKTTITITAAETAKYNQAVATVEVKVVPKAVNITKAKCKNHAIQLKWPSSSKLSGYLVIYSENKDFTGAKKAWTNKKGCKGITLTKVTAGKKYYCKVVGYKKVDGKKYFAPAGKVKAVTVK